MISYRCYFYDGANHILKVETADHASDPAAMAWAVTLHREAPNYAAVEVWQGARLIDRRHASPTAT